MPCYLPRMGIYLPVVELGGSKGDDFVRRTCIAVVAAPAIASSPFAFDTVFSEDALSSLFHNMVDASEPHCPAIGMLLGNTRQFSPSSSPWTMSSCLDKAGSTESLVGGAVGPLDHGLGQLDGVRLTSSNEKQNSYSRMRINHDS